MDIKNQAPKMKPEHPLPPFTNPIDPPSASQPQPPQSSWTSRLQNVTHKIFGPPLPEAIRSSLVGPHRSSLQRVQGWFIVATLKTRSILTTREAQIQSLLTGIIMFNIARHYYNIVYLKRKEEIEAIDEKQKWVENKTRELEQSISEFKALFATLLADDVSVSNQETKSNSGKSSGAFMSRWLKWSIFSKRSATDTERAAQEKSEILIQTALERSNLSSLAHETASLEKVEMEIHQRFHPQSPMETQQANAAQIPLRATETDPSDAPDTSQSEPKPRPKSEPKPESQSQSQPSSEPTPTPSSKAPHQNIMI